MSRSCLVKTFPRQGFVITLDFQTNSRFTTATWGRCPLHKVWVYNVLNFDVMWWCNLISLHRSINQPVCFYLAIESYHKAPGNNYYSNQFIIDTNLSLIHI